MVLCCHLGEVVCTSLILFHSTNRAYKDSRLCKSFSPVVISASDLLIFDLLDTMHSQPNHGLAQLQVAMRARSKNSNYSPAITKRLTSHTRPFPRISTGGTKHSKFLASTARSLARTLSAYSGQKALIRWEFILKNIQHPPLVNLTPTTMNSFGFVRSGA